MDNQQRFQNTGSQDRYQQSGFDNDNANSGTLDPSNPSYNPSTGSDSGTGQQYGDPGDQDNRNIGAYPTTRGSATGSGFDNNAPNISDKPSGYNAPASTQTGGDYNTTGSGGDYSTENTGIDDSQDSSGFKKPSAGDKMRGSAEKMMGKMTGNPSMQERGDERKTGNLNDY